MEYPSRKRNRLSEYDYSETGYYFVTVCVKNRSHLLWIPHVGADSIRPDAPLDFDLSNSDGLPLSSLGKMTDYYIRQIPVQYAGVSVPQYCIMPDHIHMVVVLERESGLVKSLSTIMGQWKRAVSRSSGVSLWQKSFYDRVIRNEREYQAIWKYIDENPLRWQEDRIVY